MKTQKYNHITRVLVAVGLFSMVIPALAAQVPPGTALAEKQELVRNNGSEPSSLLSTHKVLRNTYFLLSLTLAFSAITAT
ncbi:oligopeptide ABC transporter substrate-binding protein OppA, partial [Klebsiella michiganensis]